MDRRRILGAVAGIIILVAVFVLPFGPDLGSPSLFSSVLSVVGDLGQIHESGDAELVALSYIMIGAFIILVIAGAAGVFPLGAGIMGLVGMVVITMARLVLFPGAPSTLSLFGVGYFVGWAASVAALATRFTGVRVEAKAEPVPEAEVAPGVPAPKPPPLPKGELYIPEVAAPEGEEAGPRLEVEVGPGETTPDEVLETVNSLMKSKRSGEISSEQLREEVQKLVFRDLVGRFWAIDFRFGRWSCYENEAWVKRKPPSRLKPVDVTS